MRRSAGSQNRRSGAHILDAANAVAEPLRVLHPQVRPLVPGTTGTGGLRVALLDSQSEEVEWVGDRVAEQVRAGVPAGDIAILCRGSRDFPALLNALAERDIPVQVKGLDGMLSVPEVAEVVAVLDLLHDSTANPALVRLLAGPRWRIGPRDLAVLGRRGRDLARGGRPGSDTEIADQLDEAVGGIPTPPSSPACWTRLRIPVTATTIRSTRWPGSGSRRSLPRYACYAAGSVTRSPSWCITW